MCGYQRFLSEVADRDITVLITELDVLDDGLPANATRQDIMVADVYRRYLDVALAGSAVAAVTSFGLSDRFSWLEEDDPRDDGARRRPLAFNRKLRPKAAFRAVHRTMRTATPRRSVFVSPREDEILAPPRE